MPVSKECLPDLDKLIAYTKEAINFELECGKKLQTDILEDGRKVIWSDVAARHLQPYDVYDERHRIGYWLICYEAYSDFKRFPMYLTSNNQVE